MLKVERKVSQILRTRLFGMFEVDVNLKGIKDENRKEW